jgi:hypothetical protein
MSEKSKADQFIKCGSTRLTKEDKVNIAMAVYLTLDAVNHTAPTGCDGKPAELTVPLGDGVVVIQNILTQILERFGAPIPELPEVETKEGHCVCGNELEDEEYN